MPSWASMPQMLVLFLMLCALEDCGYMARIAFIMDRIFRRFGLSGKILYPHADRLRLRRPGIMASRTIEQDRDRKMTIMTTTFHPCGAKMPIVALIAGALFGGAVVGGRPLHILYRRGGYHHLRHHPPRRPSCLPATPPPVMELPQYHLPTVKMSCGALGREALPLLKRPARSSLLSSIFVWFTL